MSDGAGAPSPARCISGAQPLGGGAQVPGVGGDHERPARVERQPVQREPVHGGVRLAGVHHLAGQHAVPGKPRGREQVRQHRQVAVRQCHDGETPGEAAQRGCVSGQALSRCPASARCRTAASGSRGPSRSTPASASALRSPADRHGAPSLIEDTRAARRRD